MIHLPSTPSPFMSLLGRSIRHHFSVFRKIVLLVVFLVVVKDAYIYWGGMPSNPYLYGLVGIVMGLLILYLLVAMLYVAHCVFNNEDIDWRSALKDTFSRMGRVLVAFVVFVVVPALLFMFAHWIERLIIAGDSHPSSYSSLILVLSVGIPVMLAYLYYFFTIPLIVAENFGVWPAFKRAPRLVGRDWQDLVRVFGVYACGIAIWILISPDTLHGHLLKVYQVSAVFDLIALSVTLPIIMNLVVLMRHDLKLRKEIRDADG